MVKTSSHHVLCGNLYPFRSTVTSRDERFLAHSLGYPPNWHVSRIAPHPHDIERNPVEDPKSNVEATLISNSIDPEPSMDKFVLYSSCLDTIYAGNPEDGVDTYYNHSAAYEAAMKWNSESSTGYDNDGGQMMPQQAKYCCDDSVEVFYFKDKIYIEAVIKKVNIYDNVIRYTVCYEIDYTIQSNINENEIRETMPIKENARLKYKKIQGIRKNQRDLESNNSTANLYCAEIIETLYLPDTNNLKLAVAMSLPEGWTARRTISRYIFTSPDGNLTFYTIESVFRYLSLPIPLSPKILRNKLKNVSKTAIKINRKYLFNFIEEIPRFTHKSLFYEDGDPPWRISNHQFIGGRIHYIINLKEKRKVETLGTITGWISATDLDKQKKPGFVSELNGKPASLFHVTFEEKCSLEFQDIEEYEVKQCLLNY